MMIYSFRFLYLSKSLAIISYYKLNFKYRMQTEEDPCLIRSLKGHK
jgi:hypothetical protein